MADCTVADVLNDSLSLLGDPDGEITSEQTNDYQTAYSELMSALLKFGAPEIVRDVYFTLPANTNVLFPVSLGVTDFAEPSQIWERGTVTSLAITAFTDGSPIKLACATLPAPPDGRVEIQGIQGVPGYVNRDWFITATGNPGEFTLNGSILTGIAAPTLTGATANWSSDEFRKMTPLDVRPPSVSSQPQNILGVWRWEERFLYFPNACNQPRQLWIEYLANEAPPASGVIGLLNGRELKFLSHATAAHFAPKRQLPMGPQLAAWAYGPSGQPDSSGGFLRELILPIIKQKNALPRRMGLMRIRRGIVSAIV
jgi:hypothetical protein